MPDLIYCEFQKLRNKKFVLFTILAAALFPIPMTFVMYKDGFPFRNLFRTMFLYGDMLFLPCVLGILASMLFFMERDNDTLKNLMTIPLSKAKILLAKLSVLLFLSVLYSISGLGATVLGGVLVGGVSDIPHYLLCSIGLGAAVFLATLPLVVIIIICNRNYTISVLLSFIYALLNFFVVNYMSGGPELQGSILADLPMPLVFRWYIHYFSLGEQFSYLGPYALPPIAVFVPLILVGIVFSGIAVFFYKNQEV